MKVSYFSEGDFLFVQLDAKELAHKICNYKFKPPLPSEAAVPGLNQILKRMLVTNRARRFRDAAMTAVSMELVAREPDVKLCRDMLEKLVVPVLRSLFLEHWKEKSGSPWDDTRECGQRYMEEEKRRNRRAAAWRDGNRLAMGNSAEWDTSALCTILLWSQVHPLRADEAPQDHADVSQIVYWRNVLYHTPDSVVWDGDKAAKCAAVMWDFIERHQLLHDAVGSVASTSGC